jgi:hypothetical protein
VEYYTENDVPFGKLFSEWVVKWWQSYDYAGWRRNLGSVFVIPSKIHNENLNERSYKVKKDKALLLSPINWISFDDNGKSEESMRNIAKEEIDIVSKDTLNVLLDGKEQMREYCCRVSTPLFKLHERKAVADGYWIFLKPDVLPKGNHTISSFGSCRSGKIQIEIDYHLNII